MRTLCQVLLVTSLAMVALIPSASAAKPAPMSIAIVSATPEAALVRDAREVCEQSSRIEVMEPDDASGLLELARSASAAPSPTLEASMYSQGLEALILIEQTSSPTSFTIATIGPKGQVHERSTFSRPPDAINYKANLARVLQSNLASAAPHVLAERERRPKPTPALTTSAMESTKEPTPETSSFENSTDSVEDKAPPEPANADEVTPPSSSSEDVALAAEENVSPAPEPMLEEEALASLEDGRASEETSTRVTREGIGDRDHFSEASAGPVLYDIFIQDGVELHGNITAPGAGVSLLKIKRFPAGSALRAEVSANIGGSASKFPDTVTVRTQTLVPEELSYTSPPPDLPPRELPTLGLWRTALDLKLDLPSKRIVQLGPAIGVEHMRTTFYLNNERTILTTGKLGLSMLVTTHKALIDLSFFSQLGRLAVGDGSFSSGICFQPKVRVAPSKRGFTLSTGLRLATHASSNVDPGDYNLAEVRQRLILAEFALGYARQATSPESGYRQRSAATLPASSLLGLKDEKIRMDDARSMRHALGNGDSERAGKPRADGRRDHGARRRR